MSKTNPLFDAFEPVSAKQWKQKIQFDLKGADYNETLVWHSNEGIAVKPFYHADDQKTSGSAPKANPSNWKIGQTIYVADTEKSNSHAIDAIARGAESMQFIIPNSEVSVKNLLQNIDLDRVPIYFDLLFIDIDFIKSLYALKGEAGIFINNDIIGHLASTGNFYKDLKTDFSDFLTTVKITNSITVNTSMYQNAGANMVQQLAYALAQVNEYLNQIEKAQEKAMDFEFLETLQVVFKVSVGSNYFFEIGKLRALRLLWQSLSEAYHIKANCKITAVPTKRNKTIYDYNTNMLRTTTESMSAVLGGADVVTNLPYDAIYHKTNEFGERIARNQLLILKNESYFDKVNNPADGTYYIESLTEQLAEKALALFKDIEAHGGFLSQLKNGIIQKKIKESAVKEQEQFNKGEVVILGTNKHPNPNDKMKDDLELYPFIKTKPHKTLIEPIIGKRLSEQLEQDRLKNE
ncbi:methylmalonyl-CoA mutase subunit beta [Gaetbulibacter aestuarii]|uniref:Methylmalonyl-CoA mutase subunit beta n=1 Tax=Gaetbulibacter aestuarii TaxID=1502358 RepID=A0ABW7N1G6_9FLAO